MPVSASHGHRITVRETLDQQFDYGSSPAFSAAALAASASRLVANGPLLFS
ncbi:hypothetical protein BVC80_1605g27 [Macleaya cordata]|uniref:Uncharacterized protein n=1 Tax=Macleaya cordata TaxID=56857 RepID=A0A200QA69_MACCD|nr:hypothetical protein BVC80_1605g27 [Macleaya cordata]